MIKLSRGEKENRKIEMKKYQKLSKAKFLTFFGNKTVQFSRGIAIERNRNRF